MALRIKYRTKTDAGQIKRRLPLLTLSVHPENRGGVYPQGDDVKQLAIRLAKAGFSQEEADHQGVCVHQSYLSIPENIPEHRIEAMG